MIAALLLIAAVLAFDGDGSDRSASPCSFQSTIVEKRICATPVLSSLERRVRHSYAVALAESYDAISLQNQQVAWIARIREVCRFDACFIEGFHARIAALERSATASRRRHALDTDLRSALDWTRPELTIPAAVRAKLLELASVSCLRLTRRVDLGDGRLAILALECKRDSDGAFTFLFEPVGHGFTMVFVGTTSDRRGLALQDARSNGLRRLRTQVGDRVVYSDFGEDYRCIARGSEVDEKNRISEFYLEQTCRIKM